MRPPVRFPARGTRLSIMSHTSYRQELHLRNASIPWLTPHAKWAPCLRHVDFWTSIVQSRGNNDTFVWRKRQMPPVCRHPVVGLKRRVKLSTFAPGGLAVCGNLWSRDFPSSFEHNLLRIQRIADRHMRFCRVLKVRGLNFYKSVACAPCVLPSAR